MKKGDKIRFLDAVGGGIVVQVDAQRQLVWVGTDDGFDVGPLPMAKCVVCTEQSNYQLSASRPHVSPIDLPVRPAKDSSPHSPMTSTGKRLKRQKDEYVIDLHLEALPSNGSSMTDIEKHQYQLRYFRMMMQQYMRYRGRRVVVIHGKGQGVLRNEIRQILKRDFANQVEVHDADFSRYEEGATLVIIK
jgi:hypothetical protein